VLRQAVGFHIYWEGEWHNVLGIYISGGGDPTANKTHLLIVCSEEYYTNKIGVKAMRVYDVQPRWIKLSDVEKVAL
jgi:hypothetical protein